ncbi:MAG TPA: hypothetical protein VMH49_07315 [Thermoplasmata archaeon]|nr:hypothetical protein [Thermoplasmata archaeon]
MTAIPGAFEARQSDSFQRTSDEGRRYDYGDSAVPSLPGVIVGTCEVPDRCRCGARLAPGGRVVRAVHVPPEIALLLGPLAFCGSACVRAWLLEALEFVDATDRRLLADRDAVARALRLVLAVVDSARFAPYFDA